MDFLELMNTVNELEKKEQSFDKKIKLAFLRNFTIEGIKPFLQYHLYKTEICPEFFFGGYNTMHQELWDETSGISRGVKDITVAALTLEQMEPDYNLPGWQSHQVKEQLSDLFTLLAGKSRSLVIVNTFLLPFYSETGIAHSLDNDNLTCKIADLNQFIRKYAQAHAGQFIVADWENFQRQIGEQDSMDYRNQYMFKAPFKPSFLNAYALEIAKSVRALLGQTKKCLALDCDNTLWGGIIGEDGIHGIALDRNEYPGNIYYEFQKTILQLQERGVLIALCSKNNESDVWDVLDKHPHCLIKRSHLAAWQINWDDKAQNLKNIAKQLNIGNDSFVFVDDNPLECDIVKKFLPEVTVLQVPKKMYLYPKLLFTEGLFDTLTISAEDRNRTAMYRQEQNRTQQQQKYQDINEYLATLHMEARIKRADSQQIPRIAQLTQKTNQFNLTTRRYSEAEIENFLRLPEHYFVFTLQAADKFGDLGLTGVFIAQKQGQEVHIDTFLMSCRILGRKLEQVFLGHCLQIIEQQWKFSQWRAQYLPTAKNRQVANFWQEMGFNEIMAAYRSESKEYILGKGQQQAMDVPFITIVEESYNGT